MSRPKLFLYHPKSFYVDSPAGNSEPQFLPSVIGVAHAWWRLSVCPPSRSFFCTPCTPTGGRCGHGRGPTRGWEAPEREARDHRPRPGSRSRISRDSRRCGACGLAVTPTPSGRVRPSQLKTAEPPAWVNSEGGSADGRDPGSSGTPSGVGLLQERHCLNIATRSDTTEVLASCWASHLIHGRDLKVVVVPSPDVL